MKLLVSRGAVANNETIFSCLGDKFIGPQSVEIARYLLHNGAKIDATVLPVVVHMRSAQILELLLEYGPEISRDDLGLVVEIGSTRIVEKLVNDGANVNPNTKEATTPLEIAALHYDPDMVRLLLDFGAKVTEHTLSNVFSKNVQGMGRKGDMNNTVKILLDRSQVGIQRALPKAIGNGSVEAVKAMISKGVKFGEPELELAARWEHIEVVKLLVMNGVKVDAALLAVARRTLCGYQCSWSRKTLIYVKRLSRKH